MLGIKNLKKYSLKQGKIRFCPVKRRMESDGVGIFCFILCWKPTCVSWLFRRAEMLALYRTWENMMERRSFWKMGEGRDAWWKGVPRQTRDLGTVGEGKWGKNRHVWGAIYLKVKCHVLDYYGLNCVCPKFIFWISYL